MEHKFYLGVVADDFTGAGDAASFLAQKGLRTYLVNGLPQAGQTLPECDAVVVALKSRSLPAEQAVEDCGRAFAWLKESGAQKLYFKYCSTFDSTPQGNIGPVADHMLAALEMPFTLLCPGLPVNGRTVQDGVLYVNGVPLAESPMKDHPLNPMWASQIGRLMQPQSAHPCLAVSRKELENPDRLQEKLARAREAHRRFYLVPDHTCDQDAELIVRQFGGLEFYTGGSGLMGALASLCPRPAQELPLQDKTAGDAILMAGSCSVATTAQVARYRQNHPALAVQPQNLLDGSQTLEELVEFYRCHRGQSPLFYTLPADPATLTTEEARTAHQQAGAALENTLAALAQAAAGMGAARFIVAGGETSGAVARQLGFYSYRIGTSVAPGVPVMAPLENPQVRVVYKSGNFGDQDFFEKALALTQSE